MIEIKAGFLKCYRYFQPSGYKHESWISIKAISKIFTEHNEKHNTYKAMILYKSMKDEESNYYYMIDNATAIEVLNEIEEYYYAKN